MNKLVEKIALEEGVTSQALEDKLGSSRAIIFKASPSGKAVAVGEGLRVKVNANIGTSPDLVDEDLEVRKLDAAVKAGADAVMDLSMGEIFGQ